MSCKGESKKLIAYSTMSGLLQFSNLGLDPAHSLMAGASVGKSLLRASDVNPSLNLTMLAAQVASNITRHVQQLEHNCVPEQALARG